MANNIKLTRIDDSNIGDHSYLVADDECYFLLEYTSGKGYSYGKANSLISNLKKKPSRSSAAELRYKSRAVDECAIHFRRSINLDWLAEATLVPVPPSKTESHLDYDNRITRICKGIATDLDVRELVIQTSSLTAAHEGLRHTVEDLLNVYEINEKLASPAPKKIAIFDDMLTAGAHYRAMCSILNQRFPGVRIVGFFAARRIFPNPFDEFDDV